MTDHTPEPLIKDMHLRLDGFSLSSKGMGHVAKVLQVPFDKVERTQRAQRIVQCVNALSGIEDVELFMRKIRSADCEYHLTDCIQAHKGCTPKLMCARCEALALFPQPKEPK